MSEATLHAKIMKELRSRGCAVLKIHGSMLQSDAVDLIGCRGEDGRAFAIEVKLPGKDLTLRQARFLGLWRSRGALTGAARSVADALEIVYGVSLKLRPHSGVTTNCGDSNPI